MALHIKFLSGKPSAKSDEIEYFAIPVIDILGPLQNSLITTFGFQPDYDCLELFASDREPHTVLD